MKKIILVLLSLLLPLLSSCKIELNKDEKKLNNAQNQIYEYKLLYAYQGNVLADSEQLEMEASEIAQMLQSRGLLDVEKIGRELGYLRIDYKLALTEEEPRYKINYNKIMQDCILLYALYQDLEGITINYMQSDYSFGVDISRAEAQEVFGEEILAYAKSQEAFAKLFPPKLESIEYNPELMDTVNYFHVMGLDE